MERETGIEPATNSLEGCDSTTELLPPSCLAPSLTRHYGEAGPPSCLAPSLTRHYGGQARLRARSLAREPSRHGPAQLACQPKLAKRASGLPSRSSRSEPSGLEAREASHLACQPKLAKRAIWPASRSSRSERRLVARGGFEPPKPLGRQIYSLLRLTAPQPRLAARRRAAPRQTPWRNPAGTRVVPGERRLFRVFPAECRARSDWSWRRDSNPRPADYKSAALPD
jgi:hypothetical protein